MASFLVSSISHLWPYYFLALFVGEVLLFLRERNGLFQEIAGAVILSLLLLIISLFQIPSFGDSADRSWLMALVNLLSILLPISVIVIANKYLSKIHEPVKKHVGLVCVISITMFVWPLWSLSITCASGLDCL